MNHDELRGIIQNGDPFMWLGGQIYGNDQPNMWPVKRQALKNGFYAMTYGAGGAKLASTIGGGMTVDDGRKLARDMKSALGDSYYRLNSRLRSRVENGTAIKTVHRRAQHVAPDKSYVALNALIQGSAADVMKRAMVAADEALRPFGAYPVLVVHDELVVECPAEHAEAAKAVLEEVMVAACPEEPMKVEGVICPNNYAEGKG